MPEGEDLPILRQSCQGILEGRRDGGVRMIQDTVGKLYDLGQQGLILHDDFTDIIGARGVIFGAINDALTTLT